jgi:hypothetical protein
MPFIPRFKSLGFSGIFYKRFYFTEKAGFAEMIFSSHIITTPSLMTETTAL